MALTSADPEVPSWIPQERMDPSQPPPAFLAVVIFLALATTVLLLVLASRAGDPTPSETAFTEDRAGPWSILYRGIGVDAARAVSAILAGVAILGAGFAGRRLFHSSSVGATAAALVALDPAFLAESHLALPSAPLLAMLLVSLAAFLHIRPAWHVAGVAAMVLAVLVTPWALLWSIPLVAILMLRGHIYAAPKHLSVAAAKAFLVPAVAAALVLGSARRLGPVDIPACLVPGRGEALFLQGVLQHGEGLFAVYNPVTWFGGLGAIVMLGLAALAYVLRDFRLARLPGRVQVRISTALPRHHGRILWLALLVVMVPHPVLWLPLLAMALAAGIEDMSRDARAFGITVQAAAILFAIIYLARVWSLVVGGADSMAIEDLAPWSQPSGCFIAT